MPFASSRLARRPSSWPVVRRHPGQPRRRETGVAVTVTDEGGVNGGATAWAFYFHQSNVKAHDSTISNNSSPGCATLQADASTLDFVNVTLSGNVATAGVGGAICIFSNGGTLTNCTVANNQANGGSSYSSFYGAAIFGGGLTLDNTIVADNTTMNTQGRMTCAATEAGTHDVQWPKDKVAAVAPIRPVFRGSPSWIR